MKKPVPELIRRQRALDRTLARFRGRELVIGKADCVRLVLFHLRAMGWRTLPKVRPYRTALAGKRELDRLGFANLEAAADAVLERIAAAAMLPGDIVSVMSEPGEEAADIGTFGIAAGGTKFIGWHPDKPDLAVADIALDNLAAAWRA